MNRKPNRLGGCLVLALMPLLVAGCNKKLSLSPLINQPPTIRLSAAPVDTLGADGKRASYIYHYRMNWVGYDPDGRVSYFLYTVDPPGSPGGGEKGRDPAEWVDTTLTRVVIHDTTYCKTTLNEKEIFFRARRPDEPIDRTDPHASDIHTFVIKAVDNSGAFSAPEFRSFFSNTQAPTVRIDQPAPSALFYGLVSPFVTISWHGDDPDGVFTQKCVKYKFKMFKKGSTDDQFDFELMRSQPDSLRRFYAPTFAGWDSSSADTTFHTFTNLVPDAYYMFVVVGFDEAGAYSPIFSRSFNMLQMFVTFAGKNGPVLCIFNEFFFYCYPSGGYALDPSRYINIEVPAKQPVHFNWDASEPDNTRIKLFRWAMDIANLDDNTPRSDERTDTRHWSQAGAENKSATVGPFLSDTTHFFFIESEDVNGLKSLGIVNFRVVVPTFNHDLLVVNDTQRLPDSVGEILWKLGRDRHAAHPSRLSRRVIQDIVRAIDFTPGVGKRFPFLSRE